MASDALLRIKIIADASQAALGLDKASGKASKFQGAMRKAALPAAAVGAAVVAMGKKAVDAASDLQQANGAVEAVFGKGLAGAVEKNAKSAATTMGLSAAQYKNYAALVGTSLQNAGFSASESVAESNKAMQRGADLSALYGGTTADAVDAINAAVSRSEFDPLEKYGVSLNMTKVNALLAAKGQDKLTGSALETAKKQAILEQIYNDTGKAAGQYAREADSVAGKQQTAAAQWENTAATLGTVLLPLVAKFTGYLAQLATWAAKNATAVQILAGVLLGLAAAILAINAAFKVYSAATKVAAAVQWLFNAAMAANPVVLVVIAIIALVAIMVVLYRRSSTVRNAVNALWSTMKNGALTVWRVIQRAFNGILNAIKSVLTWVKRNWPTILAVLTGPIGVAVLLIAKNWAKIKTGALAVVAYVKEKFSSLKDKLTAPFDAAKDAAGKVKDKVGEIVTKVGDLIRKLSGIVWPGGIGAAIDTVTSAIGRLIDKIRGIHWPSPPKFLSKLPGFSMVAPPAVASRAAYAATAPRVGFGGGYGARSSAGGGGVSITVNGAVDPEATARQINRILTGHTRRVGLAS